MNLKTALATLLFAHFIAHHAFAQGQAQVDVSFALGGQIGQPAYQYLLADSVNLRSCPSAVCEQVSELYIGQRIELLEQTEVVDTIRGIKAYWYKVKAGKRTGFLWGGLIASAAQKSHTNPEVAFVFGLWEIAPNQWGHPQACYQIRAFQGHQEIAKYQLLDWYIEPGSFKNHGNCGLAVGDILSLRIPCRGGCGCTAGDLYIFWNGREFSYTEALLGTGDAWASEWTNYIFPIHMEGIAGVVIRQADLFVDELSDGRYKRKIVKDYFVWNGHKLVPWLKRGKETSFYIDTL
jgi:hypothetical protein